MGEYITSAAPIVLDEVLSTLAERMGCTLDTIGLCLIVCTPHESRDGERVQLFGNMPPRDISKLCRVLVGRYESGHMEDPPEQPTPH